MMGIIVDEDWKERLKNSITNILKKISYKSGYSFDVDIGLARPTDQICLLRVRYEGACINSGESKPQIGRWLAIQHPTGEQEVIRTVYQALYLFEIHELQEHFKYNGEVVFNPHHMNLKESQYE